MEYRWIEQELKEQGIAVLSMNRPEKRNALNLEMMEEICSAIEGLQRSSCRVVIITGRGKSFCSGLDLKEAADPSLIESTAEHVARLLLTVSNTPLVTIAAIGGDALAGGAGLAMACDLAVIASGASIGFPEVRRGLVAALVSTILARQICGRHMRELLLTGELVGAARALEMGLASLIAGGDALNEAYTLAQKVVKGGVEAVRMTKRLIGDLAPRDLSADIQHALALHHSVRHSKEAMEGIAAFLDKK